MSVPSKISTDPGLLKIRQSDRFVAVVIHIKTFQIAGPKNLKCAEQTSESFLPKHLSGKEKS